MPTCLCMGNGEKQSVYCFQRTRGSRTRVYMKYAFSGARHILWDASFDLAGVVWSSSFSVKK